MIEDERATTPALKVVSTHRVITDDAVTIGGVGSLADATQGVYDGLTPKE